MFMQESPILTEGAIAERLRRDPSLSLDPHIAHAGLIYDPLGTEILSNLYRQYLDIGAAYDLPMLVFTPTRRANPIRLKKAGFEKAMEVNRDCSRFIATIRSDYGEYARRISIGGVIGCAGDAYRPAEALPEDEAACFHRAQVEALAATGVDFLMAATLPAASEAAGIALAMASFELPYVLSFVVRATGALLDGTPLHEAVLRIDRTVERKPLGYMVNCVHPTVFQEAMAHQTRRARWLRDRVIGLMANTSTRTPEALNHLAELDTQLPDTFAEEMLDLHKSFGTRVLGGCCGTDQRHIEAIARRLETEPRDTPGNLEPARF